LPDRPAVAAVRSRLEQASFATSDDNGGFLARDPWQTAFRVRTAN
jgi:hypothetical protein